MLLDIIISFLATSMLTERLSGLDGLHVQTPSGTVMKKVMVHVIELAEWCYSEVVQANKMRGNNEHLHSMASTRLGSNISSALLHYYRSGK